MDRRWLRRFVRRGRPGTEWRRRDAVHRQADHRRRDRRLGRPGYGESRGRSRLGQAAADRPGPVRARTARAHLPQRRRRLGRRDRAVGHHRQGAAASRSTSCGAAIGTACPATRAASSCRSGEQRAEDAAARRAEGWRAIKLRLHDWTMQADIAQVEARAQGDGRRLRHPGRRQPGAAAGHAAARGRAGLDATSARCRPRASSQRLGVFWLEEPLDRYDFDGLRRLCAAVDMLIAGGENNRGLHELRWLIEQDVLRRASSPRRWSPRR